MKKLKYILSIATVAVYMLAGQSCDNNDTDFETLTWKETTSLRVSALGEQSNFIKEVNLSTMAESWATDTLELNCELNWESGSNPVNKVDFYIYCQEQIGEDVILHGEGNGKLLKTVSDSTVSAGDFNFKISVDDVYNLFGDDFQVARTNKLLVSDLFEIRWVLHSENGETIDKRVGRFTPDDLYSFSVDKIADIWSGTFDYTYNEVGSGSLASVGQTGTITFTKTANGEYTVTDAEFGGSWDGVNVSGTVYYDYASGEVAVLSGNEDVWSFSNFNGTSVDIYWTNVWTPDYDEWGKLTLTRNDGVDWPENLHGA